ncbi:MAG: serine/threonine-protein kinase RsbW [Solirubrobacteraceae bacterium]|jgi:serine/threonine-protein kinase RsbW/stage II sporulation protein AB (anti-sigma F factor)|nr:serine/threonine-protein kinase RsbW [Solirubrobacteraceae bacterium]
MDGAVPPRAAWTLPAEPGSVSEIRTGMRDFAAAHGAPSGVVADIALAVSELVTNAIMHGYVDRAPGTIRAEASAGLEELVIVVSDDGRGMQPRSDSPGLGLGLPLIGQLATTVDLRQSAGGGAELCVTFAAPGVRGLAPGAARESVGAAKLLTDVSRTVTGTWPGDGVEQLVNLLVPAIADACAVDVIGADGAPRRFAGRVDGTEADSAWLAGLQSRPDAPGSATRAALAESRTRVSELTSELMAAVTTTPEDAARMAETGMRWWVVVPLRDEAERLLGLLHFGSRDERGRPEEALIALYEAVAARAAGALAATRLVAELNRARRRFERILGVLAEAVTVRTPEGRIVYANDAAARLLGAASPAALVGTGQEMISRAMDLTHDDGSPLDLADLPANRLLAGREAPPLLIRAVMRDTGERRRLLAKASLLDDDEPLAVGIIEDVTDTQLPP